MKPKILAKLAVDLGMTLALIFLMGYHLWGEAPHEWVGAGLFVLFVAHHLLNGAWHKAIGKGKYNALRIITLVLDFLLLLTLLAQMYSAIVLSRYVFGFLPPMGGMALARRLHMLGAYWGFLLMGLHLELHWNLILGVFRKATGIRNNSRGRSLLLFSAALLIAGYGAWVFFDRDFPTYLLMRSEFVFLDYSEPKLFFCLDYLALLGLCIFLSHYGAKGIRKIKKKQEEAS